MEIFSIILNTASFFCLFFLVDYSLWHWVLCGLEIAIVVFRMQNVGSNKFCIFRRLADHSWYW